MIVVECADQVGYKMMKVVRLFSYARMNFQY
jgi:hypothetical protein